MFNRTGINNPMNDFNFHVPKEHLSDEFSWTLKNTQASFYKLFSCVSNFISIEESYFDENSAILRHSLDIHSFTTNSVEYFLIKINTIMELCYQIYAKLNNIKNNKDKFEKLNKTLADHASQDVSTPTMDWYDEVNTVRNRIIHGGYSLKVFIESNKVLFQAYDKDMNEKILANHGYFKENSTLIFVDKYMAHFTEIAYFFIRDFLKFTLKTIGITPNDELLDEFQRMMKNSGSCLVWHVDGHEKLERLIKDLKTA